MSEVEICLVERYGVAGTRPIKSYLLQILFQNVATVVLVVLSVEWMRLLLVIERILLIKPILKRLLLFKLQKRRLQDFRRIL